MHTQHTYRLRLLLEREVAPNGIIPAIVPIEMTPLAPDPAIDVMRHLFARAEDTAYVGARLIAVELWAHWCRREHAETGHCLCRDAWYILDRWTRHEVAPAVLQSLLMERTGYKATAKERAGLEAAMAKEFPGCKLHWTEGWPDAVTVSLPPAPRIAELLP